MAKGKRKTRAERLADESPATAVVPAEAEALQQFEAEVAELKPLPAEEVAKPDVFDQAIAAQSEPVEDKPRTRSWARRLEPPSVRYEVFSGTDRHQQRVIMFRFKVPGDKPSEEVLAVMQANKEVRFPYEDEPTRTSLRFENDPAHGKVWVLNNDMRGRFVADRIGMALTDVAHKVMEQER